MNADVPMASEGPVVAGKFLLPRFVWPSSLFFAFRSNWFQGSCFLVAALASYWLISHFIVQSVEVVGSSMTPTLRPAERFLLNRWIYHLQSPKVGDIVVIRDPGDDGLSVKRVVARGGDTVHLVGGKVFVNNRLLTEPYLLPCTHTWPDGKLKEQSLKCGPGQFVVLGDNRMNSADSRTYGPVPRQNILGMIIR